MWHGRAYTPLSFSILCLPFFYWGFSHDIPCSRIPIWCSLLCVFVRSTQQRALCVWYGNEMGNIKTKYTSHFISFLPLCVVCSCTRGTCRMYWRAKPWFVCASILFDCFRSTSEREKPLTCFTNYKIGNPSHSFLGTLGICTLQITQLRNFSFHRRRRRRSLSAKAVALPSRLAI